MPVRRRLGGLRLSRDRVGNALRLNADLPPSAGVSTRPTIESSSV
jgi:hypothetical protein